MIGWRSLTDSALACLLAPPCATCDRVLERPLDGAVCDGCWRAVVTITPPVCDRCGDPVPSIEAAPCVRGGSPCPFCHRPAPIVDRARAAGGYEGTLRTIIHALKYDGRRSVASGLAALMRARGAEMLELADALVPVPLHPRRRRQRGFNQAELLARALGPRVVHALRRVTHTAPQVDLPASARRLNVRDAFALAGPFAFQSPARRGTARPATLDRADVENRVLVLVDDVTTTGATLEACARVLKAAGAREVRAITAARVVAVQRRG